LVRRLIALLPLRQLRLQLADDGRLLRVRGTGFGHLLVEPAHPRRQVGGANVEIGRLRVKLRRTLIEFDVALRRIGGFTMDGLGASIEVFLTAIEFGRSFLLFRSAAVELSSQPIEFGGALLQFAHLAAKLGEPLVGLGQLLGEVRFAFRDRNATRLQIRGLVIKRGGAVAKLRSFLIEFGEAGTKVGRLLL
jgi:hypothetical protein